MDLFTFRYSPHRISTNGPMTPNILITGTPGVGKSKLCKVLVQKLQENKYKWHDISKLAKENKCVGEYDEELECPVLDEDKVTQ